MYDRRPQTADRILDMARSMGVRLRLEGDRVKVIGPAQSVALIKSDLAANKPVIVAHLRAAANDPADCTAALIHRTAARTRLGGRTCRIKTCGRCARNLCR